MKNDGKNINILDCTLRDGGYVNNWQFGKRTISLILKKLAESNADFIECGFADESINDNNKSVFNSIEKINAYLPKNADKKRLCAMVKFGKFPIEKIPPHNKKLISNIRVIYRKPQTNEALEYCGKLKEKGYNVHINPTFINQYTAEELVDLIQKINRIEPFCFSIVDSMGTLDEKSALKYIKTADKYLNKDILLCFHSHNNLQLSFSNVKAILNENIERNCIIDCCAKGMGRGAGNLSTECLMEYLNACCNKNYRPEIVSKMADLYIAKYLKTAPGRYSAPYYLSAKNFCHPEYATYLINRQILSSDITDKILKKIPSKDKCSFNKGLIENLCEEISK